MKSKILYVVRLLLWCLLIYQFYMIRCAMLEQNELRREQVRLYKEMPRAVLDSIANKYWLVDKEWLRAKAEEGVR